MRVEGDKVISKQNFRVFIFSLENETKKAPPNSPKANNVLIPLYVACVLIDTLTA